MRRATAASSRPVWPHCEGHMWSDRSPSCASGTWRQVRGSIGTGPHPHGARRSPPQAGWRPWHTDATKARRTQRTAHGEASKLHPDTGLILSQELEAKRRLPIPNAGRTQPQQHARRSNVHSLPQQPAPRVIREAAPGPWPPSREIHRILVPLAVPARAAGQRARRLNLHGQFTGNPFADFLLGYPKSFEITGTR